MSSAAPCSALLIAAMVAVRLLRLPVRTWPNQWTLAYAGSLNTLCATAQTLYRLWQQVVALLRGRWVALNTLTTS